jgi:hypothetical protein
MAIQRMTGLLIMQRHVATVSLWMTSLPAGALRMRSSISGSAALPLACASGSALRARRPRGSACAQFVRSL